MAYINEYIDLLCAISSTLQHYYSFTTADIDECHFLLFITIANRQGVLRASKHFALSTTGPLTCKESVSEVTGLV